MHRNFYKFTVNCHGVQKVNKIIRNYPKSEFVLSHCYLLKGALLAEVERLASMESSGNSADI